MSKNIKFQKTDNSREKKITGSHRIVITGAVQSGKSSLAWDLMKKLQQLSIPMAGFIAKGLWKNNQRCGFNLVDLKTGIMTPLAQRNSPKNSQPSSGKVPYTFFQKGIDAGYRALLPENCAHARVIIVDEMGRMEVQGQGWAPCIDPLLALKKPIHIWIIRESLVSPICQLWPFKRTNIIHVHDNLAIEKLLALCNESLPPRG
jgi:nucleoside-triphosphatase THEP1